MASREFIKNQVVRLEDNYGSDRFKLTQPMFELWCEMFKDANEDGLKVSVDEYIASNEYAPNIAGIMKIYKAKANYRKELHIFLLGKYKWVCRWYEEKPSQEVFSMFCKYIAKFPKDIQKTKADEVVRNAVSRYNSIHDGMTFEKYLKGLL